MKNIVSKIYLIFIIVTEVIMLLYFKRSFGGLTQLDFSNFTKFYFIFTQHGDSIFNSQDILVNISYFSSLVFSFLYVLSAVPGMSTNYRSIIIIRYNTRLKYWNQLKVSGFISFLKCQIITWITIILSCYLFLKPIKYTDLSIPLMILFLNSLFFMNLCINLYSYITIRHNDIMAISGITILIGVLLNIDIAVSGVSFITLGNINSSILGFIIIVVGYFLLNFILKIRISKIDLL
ncbi:hypothetical protein [Clostridium estertheticum]|uniref:hypothetical protein n=1 Tax=Clostridium estertheticum TaxID=238834 RepID=UPI001CF25F52|nr:hypothetical protein [Clostridium estertheticum]MCB2356555.1 hypothetical protein [Clostridium estertheticum]WAG43640.1 hypothetical protein LL065_24870 [Clostridium estertheticum]